MIITIMNREQSGSLDNDDDETLEESNLNHIQQASDEAAYDRRLDTELQLVRKLRSTMTSLLHTLECARDDLTQLGDRVDKVRLASEQCRNTLAMGQETEDTSDQPTDKKPAKRKSYDE
jgi:hypothetical protein